MDSNTSLNKKWIFKRPLDAFVKMSVVVYVFAIFAASAFYFTYSTDSEKTAGLVIVLGGIILIAPLLISAVPAGIVLIMTHLTFRNFSFQSDEDFMVFHQGVFNKQEKHLPYAVVQNIVIYQDIWDRILRMYTLIVENAAQGGLGGTHTPKSIYSSIGFSGNVAIIPGLSRDGAQKLKELLLAKIKTKSFKDDRTGV